ncbi:MAG TPA: hypothetical protein VMT89_17140 [Candidatus Acidoferrales bacterium]|nr:hypothetical protein [Candidatus Acidoferrales bacterium]
MNRLVLAFFLSLYVCGTAFAFNHQNPKWEAPQQQMRKYNKPYRPLHVPPQELPTKAHVGRHTSAASAPRVLASLAGLAAVALLAEWVAWLTGLSSTLFLFGAGLLVGPALGWFQPDLLFGNLLVPTVALGVAVLMFRTALNLQLRGVRLPGPFLSPTLIAVVALGAVAAALLLRVSAITALPLGAILAMIAPPIVIPLLQQIDTRESRSDYEAPALEVAGCFLAALIFAAALAGGGRAAALPALRGMGSTLLAGGVGGWLAARLVAQAGNSHLIPRRFQAPMACAVCIISFTIANLIAEGSGFLASVVMGMSLARNERFDASALKPTLAAIHLFVAPLLLLLLAARLHGADLIAAGVPALAFAAVIVAVVRPAGAFLATARLALSWRDRGWLTVMTPPGVTAAGLATLFGLRLWEVGYAEASIMPAAVLLVLAVAHSCGAVAGLLARESERPAVAPAASPSGNSTI